MKFLEWGTRNTECAIKFWEDGQTKAQLRPVTERYLRIYLPWKRKRYCVNVDDEVATQPCWHVYWHPASPATRGCYVGRWGWQ
jgi:hypothetical protein